MEVNKDNMYEKLLEINKKSGLKFGEFNLSILIKLNNGRMKIKTSTSHCKIDDYKKLAV